MGIEFSNFSEARKQWLNLKQIKEAIKKLWEAERNKLTKEINNQIIDALHEWIKVKSWDELNFLKALTLEWNTISWIDKKESDLIHPGDIIKVDWEKIFKNSKHIWDVKGFLNGSINPTEAASAKPDDSKPVEVATVKPAEAVPVKPVEPTPVKPDDSKTAYLAWVDIPNEKSDKPKYKQTYIFENWKVSLIGKNWEKIVQNNELSPESIALLKNHEKVAILSQILEIWITQANKTANWLMWKDSRDDDEIIMKKVGEVQDKFSYIFQDVQKWKEIDTNDINDIWKLILEAESEESIIWASDMEKVKWFLMNDIDNKDQKLIKIYNQMRYGWMSWNSETVKEKVANHLLSSDEFKDINKILRNPKLFEYISNNNKAELEKILWKDLSKVILETYSKIKSKQEKHRDEYAKQLELINAEKKKAWEKEINLDEFIKLNVDLSIENILTHSLLERKVENEAKRWSEKDSYKWMYANITWLWENKWFINDWVFTISDNNIDTAIDISSTLALSIVSMWVWALAARWALAAATWWARVTTLADWVNWLWRVWWLAKFWATATIEWVSFYEGTTITNNLIYWNTTWNNETWNTKEIFKSIAFMWVLRWASKVMEEAKLANAIKKDSIKIWQVWKTWLDLWKTWNTLATIWNLSEKVPALMFKNTSITAVLAEAWLLTSTSIWLEYAFEWEADWTWEEYLQAIVMVWAMKMAWKVTLRKNKDWKLEVENDTNKKSKENKKESKSKTEKIESIEKKLKWISDFWSKIDQRLSSLPFYLDKAYTFPKWFIHNWNNFRYIPREIWNSLITPKILIKDLPKNLSEWQYRQAIKNILFSSNDITWKWWVMKIWAYFTIPFTIEEIYKFNTVDWYEWWANNMSDAAITIAQDWISNMYLWIINSMILEYFNDNTILEQ